MWGSDFMFASHWPNALRFLFSEIVCLSYPQLLAICGDANSPYYAHASTLLSEYCV